MCAGVALAAAGSACARPTVSGVYDRDQRTVIRLDDDHDADGRIDVRTYFHAGHPQRLEADVNGDGQVDRWEYYDDAGWLVRLGRASVGDGREDTWVRQDGEVMRVDIATLRDGVIDRREVYQLDPQPGHMRLTLDGGEVVESRAAVLACGASYSLQRRLGMGLPAVALNSAQVEAPAGRTGDVELHFGNEIAPGGFAWTVPVSRPTGLFVRIGLMSEGDAVTFFGRFLSRVARSWGVPADAVTEPRRR